MSIPPFANPGEPSAEVCSSGSRKRSCMGAGILRSPPVSSGAGGKRKRPASAYAGCSPKRRLRSYIPPQRPSRRDLSTFSTPIPRFPRWVQTVCANRRQISGGTTPVDCNSSVRCLSAYRSAWVRRPGPTVVGRRCRARHFVRDETSLCVAQPPSSTICSNAFWNLDLPTSI